MEKEIELWVVRTTEDTFEVREVVTEGGEPMYIGEDPVGPQGGDIELLLMDFQNIGAAISREEYIDLNEVELEGAIAGSDIFVGAVH